MEGPGPPRHYNRDRFKAGRPLNPLRGTAARLSSWLRSGPTPPALPAHRRVCLLPSRVGIRARGPAAHDYPPPRVAGLFRAPTLAARMARSVHGRGSHPLRQCALVRRVGELRRGRRPVFGAFDGSLLVPLLGLELLFPDNAFRKYHAPSSARYNGPGSGELRIEGVLRSWGAHPFCSAKHTPAYQVADVAASWGFVGSCVAT